MLRVLTYHRVAEIGLGGSLSPRLVSATPAAFRQHLEYLSRRYSLVSLADVLNAAAGRDRLPARAVLLTFDDAYSDFRAVWQLLKERGAPAVLFVPTSFPDQPQRVFWWDRLHRAIWRSPCTDLSDAVLGRIPLRSSTEKEAAVARVHSRVLSQPYQEAMQWLDSLCSRIEQPGSEDNGVLSWNAVRDMCQDGLEVGAHSRSHPDLTQVSEAQLPDEIAGSKADIERQLGRKIHAFCYPGGRCNAAVERAVAEAGFRLGFTTLDGVNSLSSGLLRLRRTNITPRTTVPVLRLRLIPAVTHLDRWRHRKLQMIPA